MKNKNDHVKLKAVLQNVKVKSDEKKTITKCKTNK